jgi:hypothetical protein
MYLDSTLDLAGVVNDPSRQDRRQGQLGPAPEGHAIRLAVRRPGAGDPKNAKNPEAGFLLMQWLTSKAQDKAVTRIGGAPMRNFDAGRPWMVLQYPEFITLAPALKYSNPDWRPIIAVWDKINVQALGVGVSEALTGKKTSQQALERLVPQVTEIMREGATSCLTRTRDWRLPVPASSAPPRLPQTTTCARRPGFPSCTSAPPCRDGGGLPVPGAVGASSWPASTGAWARPGRQRALGGLGQLRLGLLQPARSGAACGPR